MCCISKERGNGQIYIETAAKIELNFCKVCVVSRPVNHDMQIKFCQRTCPMKVDYITSLWQDMMDLYRKLEASLEKEETASRRGCAPMFSLPLAFKSFFLKLNTYLLICKQGKTIIHTTGLSVCMWMIKERKMISFSHKNIMMYTQPHVIPNQKVQKYSRSQSVTHHSLCPIPYHPSWLEPVKTENNCKCSEKNTQLRWLVENHGMSLSTPTLAPWSPNACEA